MSLPIASRLLVAWKRTQTTHRHITAVQFLVLCSIMEDQTFNTQQRSRRLGICQNSVAVAQRVLEARGLITLTPVQTTKPNLFHPPLLPQPTPAALRLFSQRQGRNPKTSHPHAP